MNTGRTFGASRGKLHSRASHITRSAHKQNLSKLRQALEQVQPPVSNADWQSKQALIVEEKLKQLKSKWQEDESDPRSAAQLRLQQNDDGATSVRRLGDAVEYDFTAENDEDDREADSAVSKKAGVPQEMKYFDTASINVKAGDGGTGCCAFRREKFVAHGGPSGGNGGDGGSIWAVADMGMSSLSSFRNKVHWKAEKGVNGSGKDMHGANAGDEYIKVPLGTIIRRKGSNDFDEPPLAELLNDGDKALLVQGGRGGRGNAAFKSAKNKAPILAEDGEEGQELWLDLELKVVADVGIIGVPNAGKSTLLSVISSAKPKIANYPFTTLVPNLGVCEVDYRTTVFADVPGLLEGAHTGLGLGHEFLRHCSRARMLVHVLDGTSPDPLYDYRAIRAELSMFSPDLARKPQLVAYNKIDVPDSGDYIDDVRELLRDKYGVAPENVLPVSAVSGEGVLELVRAVRKRLDEMPEEAAVLETNALNLQEKARSHTDLARIGEFEVESELAESRTWYVHGDALERFAQMTNWDYFEAVLRFQRVLEACGLCATLRQRGVMQGDTVVIGEVQFEWSDDQSEGALYESWIDDINARGKVGKGSARWPHVGG